MMRIGAFIFLTLLTVSLFPLGAQDKFPSLLWEISGNGLKKPSYLYGTMHVSNKIAFNLGDEFFQALQSSDAIALETNPEEWLSFYKDSGLMEVSQLVFNEDIAYSDNYFYNKFTLHPEYNLETFQRLMRPQDHFLNQLLYRYNFGQENYEETTYLDMFIFQTAKKANKDVYSLEDFIESFFLAERASLPDEDEDVYDYHYDRGYRKELETFYLERNLDKLDSIISKNFSANYRKYLLNMRNQNMVDAMDSIIRSKSLFAGVGAAHLAGEAGMISLLRQKGYTVVPVTYHQSSRSTKAFKKIKSAAVNVPLKEHVSFDKKIKLQAPGKFYPEMYDEKNFSPLRSYFCPDYANGAYYGYERLIKLDFVKKSQRNTSISHIDSVLYLITPGEIAQRKRLKLNDYPALEVLSELPRGNFVKLLVVETPLEIIVFKAGGNESFIKSKNVSQFFKSIQIFKKSETSAIARLGVNIDFPQENYLTFFDQGDFFLSGRKNNRQYTIQSSYLTDFDNLEEDSFELNYLIKKFAKKLEAQIISSEISEKNGRKEIRAVLKVKDSNVDLHVMSTFYHNWYYFLTANDDLNNSHKYFDSFSFTQPELPEHKFKLYKDTILKFTAQTYYESLFDEQLYEKFQLLKDDFLAAENKNDSLNDSYEKELRTKVIINPLTGEKIVVSSQKTNLYFSFSKGLEGLREQIMLKGSRDSLYYDVCILQEEEEENACKINYYYSKEGSSRILYNLIYLSKDRIYNVNASYDTVFGPSEFVKIFFETFSPLHSEQETAYVLNSKGLLFIGDLISGDYQRSERAVRSVKSVVFDEKSRQKLEELLLDDTLEVLDDQLRNDLIASYFDAFFEDESTLDFLKKYYDKFKQNPVLQFDALVKIAMCKTKESTEFFMTALEEDPPVAQDNYQIRKLFGAFTYDTELLKPILPRLEKWALEYNDFLPQVIYLIDRALFLDGIAATDVSTYFVERMERRARQQLKKMSFIENENSTNYSNARDHLIEISSILYSIPENDTKFKEIFHDLDTITNKRFRAHITAKKINRKNSYRTEEIEKIISDSSYLFPFFEWIEQVDDGSMRDSIFEAHNISKEVLYYSYLRNQQNIDFKTDSCSFYKLAQVSTYKDSGTVYVYKILDKYNNRSLRAVYFVKDSDNGQGEHKVYTEALSTMQVMVNDVSEWEKKYEELIKKIEHSNRPRVNEGSDFYDSYYLY